MMEPAVRLQRANPPSPEAIPTHLHTSTRSQLAYQPAPLET
jgi:hypothetical protein